MGITELSSYLNIPTFDFIIDYIKTNIGDWFSYSKEKPLIFSSGLFLCFFIAFFSIYIIIKKSFRARLLYVIAFSIFFYYKSSGLYFILLILTALIDFLLSKKLYQTNIKWKRKIIVVFSILINIGLLFYFKYTNFLIDTINNLSGNDFHFYKIILPVGISFFTFQSISYTIEIYRNEIKPARNYIDYLFYISFFPQLVAGPIVRAKDFLPQIYRKITVDKSQMNEAFILIIIGLVKKAIISDYISINFVDRVFDNPSIYSSFENLMAVYGYALQIYCDFSGYSDMAIGIALLLGYRLPINFLTPYQSASITEFWRRWHISLSTWLKDFLYIPLGGNKKSSIIGIITPIIFFGGILFWSYKFNIENNNNLPLIVSIFAFIIFLISIIFTKKSNKICTKFNLMTTMLIGGLWHGANVLFIIWGALHGFALCINKFFRELFPQKTNKTNKILKWISIIITFHFVVFCWIFFRSKTLDQAFDIINNIISINFEPSKWIVYISSYKNVFILIAIGYLFHFIPRKTKQYLENIFIRTPIIFKAGLLGFIIWLVYATASSDTQPFIYFQF